MNIIIVYILILIEGFLDHKNLKSANFRMESINGLLIKFV